MLLNVGKILWHIGHSLKGNQCRLLPLHFHHDPSFCSLERRVKCSNGTHCSKQKSASRTIHYIWQAKCSMVHHMASEQARRRKREIQQMHHYYWVWLQTRLAFISYLFGSYEHLTFKSTARRIYGGWCLAWGTDMFWTNISRRLKINKCNKSHLSNQHGYMACKLQDSFKEKTDLYIKARSVVTFSPSKQTKKKGSEWNS